MKNTKALPPGSWLGMMGGGQLGRMFSSAASRLGYHVLVLDPGEVTGKDGQIHQNHL